MQAEAYVKWQGRQAMNINKQLMNITQMNIIILGKRLAPGA